MQCLRFSSGGFVIHRITGDWKGRVSAWYGADGSLLDAEQLTRFGSNGRPIKRNGPMWRRLEQIGQAWKPK